MTTALYIIVALLIFWLLIMIHEFGHFIVARLCGVYIEEFSIGMGPKILQRKTKKQGTLLSLRALPIGGYVSMKGENEDEDAPNSFSRKRVWQRMLIVVAGAAMNLLLGFLIVFIIVCSSEYLASTTVHSFFDNATSNAVGGLEVGDDIIRVGDVRVHTGEELTYEIMNQGHEPLMLTVMRGGEKKVLENVIFPQIEEKGIVLGDGDFYVFALPKPSFGQLLSISWHRSLSLVKMVWDSLANLVTGRFSVEAVSSPIGVTAAVKDTITESGWTGAQIVQYVLYITAVISINLGVFNLIPFPALDGGRFFFLAIEGIIRKPISREIEGRIHFIGIVLLMMLMVLVVGKDIIRLF
jgi:regulator of sigma E protease